MPLWLALDGDAHSYKVHNWKIHKQQHPSNILLNKQPHLPNMHKLSYTSKRMTKRYTDHIYNG